MQRALIESPVLGPAEEILELEGEEALGELFEHRVVVPLTHPSALRGREEELLRAPLALLFEDGGEIVSRVHGVAREVKIRVAPNRRTGAVELWLVPRLWTLTQSTQSRVFLDRSAPEILTEVLVAAGFEEGLDFQHALRERYPAREIVVQHRETDLAFVSRLCEHAGITFFFKHDAGRDRVLFTDGDDAYEAAPVPGGVVRNEIEDDRRAAFEVVETLRRVPERVLVHDYNYRSPHVELLASTRTDRPVSRGALVEYGDHAKSPEELARVALVRAQEISARHRLTEAKTRQLCLRAGHLFTLEDEGGAEHPLLATRVVVRSHHEGASPVPEGKAWHNTVTGLAAGTPFRPARRTPRPRIEGLVHGVVDGAVRGPYAEIDEQGRYRVRFAYDLAGRPGLRATHPVRMLQPHAGARYGMHFPLRAGAEVMIGFVEGDPDRPVIVGAAPNPVIPSPVTQGNLTHNVLRTGGGNEIVLDDLAAQERIRIHTPHGDTTFQLGAHEEPEVGILARTDRHITSASGGSIHESSLLRTRAAGGGTDLVGGTFVTFVGSREIAAATASGAQQIDAFASRLSALPDDLRFQMTGERVESRREPPRDLSPGQARESTWSTVAGTMSDATHTTVLDAVRHRARRTDELSRSSEPRTHGEPVGALPQPALVQVSSATAALFARDATFVYAGRTAALSAGHTARVVGEHRVHVESPEDVEIAGRRTVRVTSTNLVDVRADHFSVLAGGTARDVDEALPPEIAIALVGDKAVRIKSAEDAIVACAEKDLVLHSHAQNVRMVAKKTVSVKGASIQCSSGGFSVSAGAVNVKASGDLAVEAGGSVSLKGADITIEAGSVTIKAGSITLDGPTTVTADLTVAGAIHGG